ncbi:MAG: hypothetical protein OXC54_11515 [Rhodospirillaceae bacterium]|nr:hypothetical protein [Rhodospirillaceae bacterium]MCY4311914.1 hypothetical protein [Rhodospirillaceae bacterium]
MANLSKLADLVSTLLSSEISNVKIDSIDIEPDFDEDGGRVLLVRVVFEGDRKKLDAKKTSGLVRRLRPKMIEAGETDFPVLSFVAKSELEKLHSASP